MQYEWEYYPDLSAVVTLLGVGCHHQFLEFQLIYFHSAIMLNGLKAACDCNVLLPSPAFGEHTRAEFPKARYSKEYYSLHKIGGSFSIKSLHREFGTSVQLCSPRWHEKV
eukprot:scaffold101319_cov38-Cyclotella_meneghiniana.AAC.2